VVAVAAAVVVTGLVAAPPAQAADGIVVWADAAHAPVITELTAGGYQGTPVTVVVKDPATVRNELATVAPRNAPDVVWGDLAWTGELASAGTIIPVPMSKKVRAQFRPNVLVGSNVGGERYGVPVQISNLALITNTKLVPQQPATFAALSDLALKLKKDKKARVPFALAQSEGTSPWGTCSAGRPTAPSTPRTSAWRASG
jgi:maltose-binding protein MalE